MLAPENLPGQLSQLATCLHHSMDKPQTPSHQAPTPSCPVSLSPINGSGYCTEMQRVLPPEAQALRCFCWEAQDTTVHWKGYSSMPLTTESLKTSQKACVFIRCTSPMWRTHAIYQPLHCACHFFFIQFNSHVLNLVNHHEILPHVQRV